MGGYGSSRWGDYSARPALGCRQRISLPFLRSLNLFNRYFSRYFGKVSVPIRWSYGGQEAGSCVVAVSEAHDEVTVTYSHRRGEEERWVPVRHQVPLLRTPCWFGGHRLWFSCPDCGRRCAVLVVVGAGLGCRVCLRLPYSSQREQERDRRLNRIRKLEERVPGDYRPRGMWRSTWARHCRQLDALVGADDEEFMTRFRHLLRDK